VSEWWSKTGQKWAPFERKTGGLFGYVYSHQTPDEEDEDINWKEVTNPLELTLELITWGRGRSAVTFTWCEPGNEERQFPMFASDLFDLLCQHAPVPRVIRGLWQVQKKGENYGIRLVKKL
jgi:hypothetical protein